MKIRVIIDQKRASLRVMKRRLKNRVANGYHTWDDMNARKAIKDLEEEIITLKKHETL